MDTPVRARRSGGVPLALLFCVTVVVDAWPPQTQRVALEVHVRQVVGADAINCGTYTRAAAMPEELNEALECARRATTKKRAFQVIQRGPSEDSEIAFGVLGKADGDVLWFDYDSAPCGGPQCQERFETVACRLVDIGVERDPDGAQRLVCLLRWR
jgi:hypothetical protein